MVVAVELKLDRSCNYRLTVSRRWKHGISSIKFAHRIWL